MIAHISNSSELTTGDQIVHKHYGVGTIVGLDTRTISGEPTEYYRIKTMESIMWLAVEEIDTAPVRHIMPPDHIADVREALQQPPQVLPDKKRARTKHIKEARLSNDPVVMASLVRDLYARQREDKLKRDERKTLQALASRLAREWAASKQIQVETAREKLRQLLGQQYPNVRPLKFRRKPARLA